MSYVNHEDTDLAASYVSGKHTRCCCGIDPLQSRCNKCRPTTQICCLKMTRSTLGHSVMLKRRAHIGDVTQVDYNAFHAFWENLWEVVLDCDQKGQTNLCGYLWSNLDCYVDEFFVRWEVSEDCETVDVKLYWVTNSGTRTVTLLCAWDNQPRDWHTGTLTGTDLETGGTITIENCEAGVDLWTDTETEPIFIQATLLHNGTSIECKFGYGNSVCGTTWRDCGYYLYPTSTVSWKHSVKYGKVAFKATANTALATTSVGDAGILEVDIYDTSVEWYDTLPLTFTTSKPEYTWVVRRVYDCSGCPAPEGTDGPPEGLCDPGCWPTCVMCPSRKRLFLVIDNAPACCLTGTYELTWTGSGYSLASPTGTSTASCGLISAFTVTCVDATHIHVSITYRVIYALESNAVTENYNLSVSCAGGHMESEAMLYRLTGDQDQLCGSGDDYGGTIRVISD